LLLIGGLSLSVLSPARALIAGFDLAAIMFIFSCLPLWSADMAAAARQRGARDDGGRSLLLIVTLATFISVLIATTLMIAGPSRLGAADIAISIPTLILAWLFANLVFAFHYSHLYYDQHGGADRTGLNFPGTQASGFADFCYFSFVIGMTCQVSDVTISDATLRKVATLLGLAAFFFNLGVLALAVNITASVI
jgi:uncharacterized membrane protein